jgi:hypothetical protein
VRAQADRRTAVVVQVGTVADGARRALPRGDETGGDVGRAHRFVEPAQFVGERTEPADERVTGEVRAHLVHRGQRGRPVCDGGEHAFAGGDHPVDATGPLVEQRLLADRERVGDRGPARRQRLPLPVVVELRLQVGQAYQERGQFGVAPLRGVGEREGGRHRLVQQRRPGRERRAALGGAHLAPTRVERGPHAVQPGEDGADLFQDPGPLPGVGGVESGDDVGHRAQAVDLVGELPAERVGVRAGGDLAGGGVQAVEPLVVRRERVRRGEEGHGAPARVGGGRVDPRGQVVDPVWTDVGPVTHRREIPV